MKFLLLTTLILPALSTSLEASAITSPARLSFDALSVESVRAALKRHGLISVTNVPGPTPLMPPIVGGDCGVHSQHTFEDGTVRSTVATHPQDAVFSCPDTSDFRHAMGSVAKRFAEALSEDLAESVSVGDHLEHFHTYEKRSDVSGDVQDLDTVDWHTDQGLFIVFTPGRLEDGSLSDGFYVRLQDGSEREVAFDPQLDQAIIMPGDMITEFVSDVYPTAHRLSLPAGTHKRSWYGRMVLPAQDAIYRDGVTFGELRSRMIDGDEEALSLGCPTSAGVVARQLETEACAEGTLMCWHRCMPLDSEEVVSDEICADRGLTMECINPRGQLWTGLHGDYFPGCADRSTAENHTDYPPIEPTCDLETGTTIETSSASTSELESVLSKFDFSVKLNGNMTFAWNMKDDGSIHAALSLNGEFGWLAFGFPSKDGKRRGMHGASIVLAAPGGNYSAVTGLDTSLDSTIAEYVIDPTDASFRKWMTPVGDASGASIVRTNDCASVLEVMTTSINGMAFNVTGTDSIIWGGNTFDTFVGYHGRENRGVFNVTWATGLVNVDGKYLEVAGGQEPPAKAEEPSSSGAAYYGAVSVTLTAVAGFAAIL